MRWKSPWVGRLAYGGGVLERGVAPGSEETPELSRERNGSGSCKRDRVKQYKKDDEVLFVFNLPI